MYKKRYIKIIVSILVVILSAIITIGIWHNIKISNNKELSEENINTEIQEKNTDNLQSVKETNEKSIEDIEKNKTTNNEIENWKIEIPEISLVAPIFEGTDEKILDKYVGHFAITPKKEGNVGLAAHNRGYPINYFENLKKLKGGEEIIYTYGNFKKTYVVTKNIKISDIDWSYLENSNKNQITLITCIENEPEYRRCVQAIEKEEN